MKISGSFLLLFGVASILLFSCNSSTLAITPTPTDFVTKTDFPISTVTLTSKPTSTKLPTLSPTITPSLTPQPSNEPGLIATLGTVNLSGYSNIPLFSPNGKIIALAGAKIQFWDVNTHNLIRELNNPYYEDCFVGNAKFSPDGKLFAISTTACHKGDTSKGHLLVWDINTGDLLQEWAQEYAKMPPPRTNMDDYIIPIYAMAFLPNNTGLVIASGHTLEIRDVFDKSKYDVLKLGPKMYASEISMSSDGRLAYIIMSWEKDHDFPALWTYQHKFQVWNINTHAMLSEVKYPEGWVNLRLELIGTRLALVDFEKSTSQIINLETGDTQEIPFRLGWRYYNSDGSLMVYARLFGFGYGDEPQAIELWKTDNWRNIYTFMPNFGKDWTYLMDGIVFSPDNTLLAISHQGQVSLWNIAPVVQP